MSHFLDPLFIIKTVGIIGILIIVFAESGLLIGFFLPGDSLLFTAGFLASQHYLNIWMLLFGTAIAAITGDSVGYLFGKKIGPALFKKEDSFLFNKKHIETAQRFYEKHGKKTIVLARFIPIVRTFAPIIAGVGQMEYKTFIFYNILGGIMWTFGLTLLGFWLGSIIPNVDRYLLPIIILIIIVSLIPGVYHVIAERKLRQKRG